jgi:CubicO group peptidase (beta-lactamase class C family)
LKLVELRRLRLEATLAELAPNIPSEWKDVTVAQLLHHQSGIADHTEKLLEAYRSGGSRSHEAAMRRLLESLKEPDKSLQFAPGGQWRYSNFGYELLAYAAASAEKRPFREIVRDHVFKPAGMSTAELEAADPNSAALRPLPLLGLAQGFNGVAGQPKPIGPVYSLIQQGAGATVAGYKDVLAFTRALGRGRLLSPAMLARNEGDSVAINETLRYGYGWMIAQAQGCTYWEHSGGTNGYVSDMIYAPDAGLTLVILSNFGFAPISDYRRDFLQALLTQGACKAGG